MKVTFNHYHNREVFDADVKKYKDTGTLDGTISFVKGTDGKDNKIFLGSEEYCSGSTSSNDNITLGEVDLGTF